MLISMPTGTSTIFEFSRSFRSPKSLASLARRRAGVEPRAASDLAQVRNNELEHVCDPILLGQSDFPLGLIRLRNLFLTKSRAIRARINRWNTGFGWKGNIPTSFNRQSLFARRHGVGDFARSSMRTCTADQSFRILTVCAALPAVSSEHAVTGPARPAGNADRQRTARARSGRTSNGSTIATCRSTSAEPGRAPAPAPMFRPDDACDDTARLRVGMQRANAASLSWLLSALLIALACSRSLAGEPSITPASMVRIGKIDEALPVLQRRNGRSDRRTGSGSRMVRALSSRLGPVRVPCADRSDQRAAAKAGGRAGAGLSARQRNLGERDLFCGFGHGAFGAAGRVRRAF